jgi:hypothetical protein
MTPLCMELAMGLRAGVNCFFVDRRWSPSPNPRKSFGFVVNVLYGSWEMVTSGLENVTCMSTSQLSLCPPNIASTP